MPKSTAKTAKKKVTVKPSVKKTSRVASKSTARVVAASSTKPKTWWDTYCMERDTFYRQHPNSQILLAVLILVILLYLGIYYWSQSMALPLM